MLVDCPRHGRKFLSLQVRLFVPSNPAWQTTDWRAVCWKIARTVRREGEPNSIGSPYPYLAPQGWLLSQTPSTDGRGAFQDPTHVSFWNSNSFWYYTRADQNRFIDCPVRFQANRLKNFFPSEWHREHQIVYVKADLLKVGGRMPGAVAI